MTNQEKEQTTHSDFDALTPDTVINLVEEALNIRCSNLCRPLNSYINRVYEIQEDEGETLIAKFYRPGRWDRNALQDEQQFMLELAEGEIPVVAPYANDKGQSLHAYHDMYFSIFPKKGGRICDEPTEDQWKELGRLLARVHVVGASAQTQHRITMSPAGSMAEHIEYILASGFVAPEFESDYEAITHDIIDRINPLFEDIETLRIHGDCHHQNMIYRPGESFYVIDFDDMAMGPPVQDLWMLLPGRVQDARLEVDLLLEGYETFRPFDQSSLRLVEPLRAMRYLHFTAWCVRQAEDGGFSRLAPDWGNSTYWRQETHELNKQLQEIEDAL